MYRYAIRSGFRSNRSRLRIDPQTRASCSIVWRSGLAASATALNAPELQPTSPSGLMPASSRALSTPTLQAPRLPPPPRTKTRRRARSPDCELDGRRRRHQDSMEGDRQNPVSAIEITFQIPIRTCARLSVTGRWKSAGIGPEAPGRCVVWLEEGDDRANAASRVLVLEYHFFCLCAVRTLSRSFASAKPS